VGNAGGAPMHAVSGVSGAAPVWRTVMDALQRSDVATEHPGRLGPASPRGGGMRAPRDARPPAGALLQAVDDAATGTPALATGAPTPPDGVVAQAIAFDGQLEAPRTEWFLAGTQTAHVTLASAAGTAARLIASPDDRSVVAIDPDIPPAVQRLRFEVAGVPPPGAAWRLDGRRLGAARPLPWSLWPGHHVLEVVDAKGVALDTVTFDVRGAQARPMAAAARGGSRAGG
jgi:penicillin-binding protein 1C